MCSSSAPSSSLACLCGPPTFLHSPSAQAPQCHCALQTIQRPDHPHPHPHPPRTSATISGKHLSKTPRQRPPQDRALFTTLMAPTRSLLPPLTCRVRTHPPTAASPRHSGPPPAAAHSAAPSAPPPGCWGGCPGSRAGRWGQSQRWRRRWRRGRAWRTGRRSVGSAGWAGHLGGGQEGQGKGAGEVGQEGAKSGERG